MERTSAKWILGFLCVVLALLEHHTIQGKCAGKWAIHACRGGNGKRSDPSETQLDSLSLSNARRKQLLESIGGTNSLPELYQYREMEPARFANQDEDEMLNAEMNKRTSGEKMTASIWRQLISQLRDLDREREMADNM